jgi:hypothetical protein
MAGLIIIAAVSTGIITGLLAYAIILLRRIDTNTQLLVNVVIPWMNHIGQVIIPNYQQIPEPPIKG